MLTLKNITKIYGSGDMAFTALKGISLEIAEGEFVAIMGPSGSGKSTLMHILGCLDMVTGGTYIFNGKNIAEMTDDELAVIRRDTIGFVFQAFNLLPRTTVLRNVMLPLIYAGIPEVDRVARAKKALHAAGFAETHHHHLSNQLSGGQIQRVAIARALVNDPALILADEPTGNLDTKTGAIVLDTFKKLNRDHGRTIVLITHEPDVAAHADRVIEIRDGSIVKDTHPRHSKHSSHEH